MGDWRRRRIAWGIGPLVALATLLLLFLVAEGTARIILRLTPPPEQLELPEARRDLPRLAGAELRKAHVRGLHLGALYETNSLGLRGPDIPLAKPADVYRIAVIGDSFAVGSGVAYEDSYAALLEANYDATQQLPPGHRIEVVNAALPGIPTQQVVGRLERLGLRYHPDLIVYGYTLNDIEGEAYRVSTRPEFTNPFYFYDSPLYLLRVLGPRWSAVRGLMKAEGSYTFELHDNYFDNPKAWAAVGAGLDRLAEIGNERGVCVVLLIHTHLYALGALHPFASEYALVAEAGRKRGFHVVESFAGFEGIEDRSLWVNPANSHPNARGHQILYEVLADGLRELPASCWRSGR